MSGAALQIYMSPLQLKNFTTTHRSFYSEANNSNNVMPFNRFKRTNNITNFAVRHTPTPCVSDLWIFDHLNWIFSEIISPFTLGYVKALFDNVEFTSHCSCFYNCQTFITELSNHARREIKQT